MSKRVAHNQTGTHLKAALCKKLLWQTGYEIVQEDVDQDDSNLVLAAPGSNLTGVDPLRTVLLAPDLVKLSNDTKKHFAVIQTAVTDLAADRLACFFLRQLEQDPRASQVEFFQTSSSVANLESPKEFDVVAGKWKLAGAAQGRLIFLGQDFLTGPGGGLSELTLVSDGVHLAIVGITTQKSSIVAEPILDWLKGQNHQPTVMVYPRDDRTEVGMFCRLDGVVEFQGLLAAFI